MKIQKLPCDSKHLNEQIENFGKSNIVNPHVENGVRYNKARGDEYLPITNSSSYPTMPVSYVDSVNRAKKNREMVNNALEERRKIALEASGADIEKDRYSHMDDFAKDLNSTGFSYDKISQKSSSRTRRSRNERKDISENRRYRRRMGEGYEDSFDTDGYEDDYMTEDVVKKKNGKWTNKGKNGTHGDFKTKKAAQAQCRAMYANGYKGESLMDESFEYPIDDSMFIATDATYDGNGTTIAITDIKYGLDTIIKFVEVNYMDGTMSKVHSTILKEEGGDAYIKYNGKIYYMDDFVKSNSPWGIRPMTESRERRNYRRIHEAKEVSVSDFDKFKDIDFKEVSRQSIRLEMNLGKFVYGDEFKSLSSTYRAFLKTLCQKNGWNLIYFSNKYLRDCCLAMIQNDDKYVVIWLNTYDEKDWWNKISCRFAKDENDHSGKEDMAVSIEELEQTIQDLFDRYYDIQQKYYPRLAEWRIEQAQNKI